MREHFRSQNREHGGIHATRDRGEPRPGLIDLLGTDLGWVNDSAVCAQADGELWHPEKGQDGRVAKALCQTCPIQAECLAYALPRRVQGVWGGLGERERDVLAGRRTGRAA